VKLPTSIIHRIPQNVTDRSAAVAEPLAIILHETIERGGIQAGDQVVIFGAGPIGLLAAAVARISGASQIILVGTEMDTACRFNIAEQIPVDVIINASREDVVERVRSVTDDRFADLAIEASGSPEAIAQSVQVIRKLGKISAVGLPGKERVNFPWQDAMFKVVDLHFNLSSSHSSWIRAVAVMGAGRMDPGFVVTHEFPLERWEEAFDIVERGEGAKVLLLPQ
jgi:threonine dehydrogenase-like Zn-dependent dehydrogenase